MSHPPKPPVDLSNPTVIASRPSASAVIASRPSASAVLASPPRHPTVIASRPLAAWQSRGLHSKQPAARSARSAYQPRHPNLRPRKSPPPRAKHPPPQPPPDTGPHQDQKPCGRRQVSTFVRVTPQRRHGILASSTPQISALLDRLVETGAATPILWPPESLNGRLVAPRRRRIDATARAQRAVFLREPAKRQAYWAKLRAERGTWAPPSSLRTPNGVKQSRHRLPAQRSLAAATASQDDLERAPASEHRSKPARYQQRCYRMRRPNASTTTPVRIPNVARQPIASRP